MSMIPGWMMLVTVSVSALGLLACEKAANLDLTYVAADGGDASADGETGPAPGDEFEGCPCDEQAGLGCCVPKGGGTPFCTASPTLCESEQGVLLKCLRPDPRSESACCWHGLGGPTTSGAVTALAAYCDAGAPACVVDQDCAGSAVRKCSIAHCGPDQGLAFGICADNPLPCP